jgi:hypothetical protein
MKYPRLQVKQSAAPNRQVGLIVSGGEKFTLRNVAFSLNYDDRQSKKSAVLDKLFYDWVFYNDTNNCIMEKCTEFGTSISQSISGIFKSRRWEMLKEKGRSVSMGWTNGINFPAGLDSFLHHDVQTHSLVHQALYPMDTGVHSAAVNRPEHKSNHTPPSTAKLKDLWNYISSTHMSTRSGILN